MLVHVPHTSARARAALELEAVVYELMNKLLAGSGIGKAAFISACAL